LHTPTFATTLPPTRPGAAHLAHTALLAANLYALLLSALRHPRSIPHPRRFHACLATSAAAGLAAAALAPWQARAALVLGFVAGAAQVVGLGVLVEGLGVSAVEGAGGGVGDGDGDGWMGGTCVGGSGPMDKVQRAEDMGG
jgi:hypothetical protein